MVPTLAIKRYKPSAGIAPTYPSANTSTTSTQKNILFSGLKTDDLTLLLSSQGSAIKINIDPKRRTTPPSLSGTDLSIA